jgi:hypothetical protein
MGFLLFGGRVGASEAAQQGGQNEEALHVQVYFMNVKKAGKTTLAGSNPLEKYVFCAHWEKNRSAGVTSLILFRFLAVQP